MSQPHAETASVDALQGVTDGVINLIGFEACAVSTTGDDHMLEVVVVSGRGDVRERLLGLRTSIADIEQQLAASAPRHGLHGLRPAQWAAPLRDTTGQLRGLVQVDLSRDLDEFDAGILDILARLVDQARHVVLNALERERLVERVRLADAARLIVRRASSELSMERIMELSQPAMAQGFEAVGMWMQTFEEDGEAIDLVYGSTEEEIVIPDQLKELSRRMATHLWATQQVAVATDRIEPAIEGLTLEEERAVYAFMDWPLEATSLLFVPLGAGRECLGNLALTRRTAHTEWSGPEKQAALGIGHDLGRALLNARTFERERRLAAELRELDGYKTRLISTLAHELKNPLTAIAGHAEMLESMPDLPGGVRHSVAAMERGAARMQHTIDNLLVLAEVNASSQPLDPAAVDMVSLVHGAMTPLQAMVGRKGIKVTVEPAEGTVMAHGEAPQLEKICANVLSNAVKYTSSGGSVSVSLSYTDDGEVEMAVSDTGIGIAEEDMGQLFREFFRSTNPAVFLEPGAGLGLPIVQRLVERHQGRIDVSSVLGVGSTFTVTVPAAPGCDAAAAVAG